jgi:hypothetical protein
MAWKPRLTATSTQETKLAKPWVGIAEDAAPQAVKLFVSIMNNTRYPIKVRMEAATRLVMIAGATFRGEKFDAHGRPAANLAGVNVARLESNALKEVLRQLPPGKASLSPSAVEDGEKVVVMHDGNHSRKPTGHVLESVIGGLVEKDGEATISPEDRQAQVEEWSEGKIEELPPPPPPTGPALAMLDTIFKRPAYVPPTELTGKTPPTPETPPARFVKRVNVK